jgi:soluble lytic murein transglycosylase-like protein
MIRALFAAFALACLAAVPAMAQDAGNLTWSAIYAQTQGATPGPITMARAPIPVPRSSIAGAIEMAARRHGVPTSLALAVARVESGMNCAARGRAGELGPLQIKPATARGLGYSGPTSALRSCGAGLEMGMRHLAAAYRRCGTVAGAARLHNHGLAASCHGGTRYTARVVGVMRRV